jgi:hypothetical protein
MLNKAYLFLLSFALILSACTTSPAAAPQATLDQNAVATVVASQATPVAVVTQPASLPVTTPTQAVITGSISGTLTFPSESTPALQVVAFNQTTGNFVGVETQPNQQTFRLENLEPGIYRLVAYLKDEPERGGGYTKFVLCGMSVDCNDHSLIDIPVVAGQEAGGINLADWYVMEPGFFPENPFAQESGSSISGTLSYPADRLLPMRVVAISVDDPARFYFMDTQMDQGEYRLENVQPGRYYVLAYQREYKVAGGYTQYVVCGYKETCTDHSLASVHVDAGIQVSGIDVRDWILAPGTYPEDPTP